MIITVQIRGPGQLVRRRTGEHVGDPVTEFEDGGAMEGEGVTAFDLRHRTIDNSHVELESVEVLPEQQVSASHELLVAGAAGAFASLAQEHQNEPEDTEEAMARRRGLDGQRSPRELLSRMHAQSMLAGPARLRLVRRLDQGVARIELRAWRGALELEISVKSFPGVASHLCRGGRLGAGARIRGHGRLHPDGRIDELRLQVDLENLPTLRAIEQTELDRLKRAFGRLHAAGMPPGLVRVWAKSLAAATRRRPEVPLLLLVALLDDLERQEHDLLGPPPQPASAGTITLNDLLEVSTCEGGEPITGEMDLSAKLAVVWPDDYTPALALSGFHPDELEGLNAAFRRVLAFVPYLTKPT